MEEGIDVPDCGGWGLQTQAGAPSAPLSCRPCRSHFMKGETEASQGAVELAGAVALTPSKKSDLTLVTFSSSMPSSLLGTADPWSQTSWAHIRPQVPTLCALNKSFVPQLPQLGNGYDTCPEGPLPLWNELSHGRLPKQGWVSRYSTYVNSL